jgi:hypothetical protein
MPRASPALHVQCKAVLYTGKATTQLTKKPFRTALPYIGRDVLPGPGSGQESGLQQLKYMYQLPGPGGPEAVGYTGPKPV